MIPPMNGVQQAKPYKFNWTSALWNLTSEHPLWHTLTLFIFMLPFLWPCWSKCAPAAVWLPQICTLQIKTYELQCSGKLISPVYHRFIPQTVFFSWIKHQLISSWNIAPTHNFVLFNRVQFLIQMIALTCFSQALHHSPVIYTTNPLFASCRTCDESCKSFTWLISLGFVWNSTIVVLITNFARVHGTILDCYYINLNVLQNLTAASFRNGFGRVWLLIYCHN